MPYKVSRALDGTLQQQYETDPRVIMALQGMQQGTSMAPVQSAGEGIARALQGPLNAYMAQKIRGQYEDKQADQYGKIADILAPPTKVDPVITDSWGPDKIDGITTPKSPLDATPPNVGGVNPNREAIMSALQAGLLDSKTASPLIAERLGLGTTSEYDTTPRTGINPANGKREQFVMDRKGNTKWLGIAPETKMGISNGTAYDPFSVNAGQHIGPMEAPKTRSYRQGTQEITEEFDPTAGKWNRVASGAAFKPETATPVDPKAVDLGVQYFMQKGTLPPTARTPALQQAIMAAASDRLSAGGQSMADVIRTAQNNKAAGDTVTAFSKGKQGDTVRSLNVSVQHLDTLRELGKALKNGDINLVNAARQKFSEAFGGAAPTDWDAAKAIVADEVAKGVIGGQTAQSDRETLADTLRRSRSPEQAEGAINTFQDLLGGQLRGLRQQYKSGTGRDDFNSKLFPETLNRLDPQKNQGGGPVKIAGDADYNKLPSGTVFIGPDGKQRRKP